MFLLSGIFEVSLVGGVTMSSANNVTNYCFPNLAGKQYTRQVMCHYYCLRHANPTSAKISGRRSTLEHNNIQIDKMIFRGQFQSFIIWMERDLDLLPLPLLSATELDPAAVSL